MPEQLGVKFIEFSPGSATAQQLEQQQILLDYMGLIARQLNGVKSASQADQLRGLMCHLPLLQPGAQARQRLQQSIRSVPEGALNQAAMQTALTIERCILPRQHASGFAPFLKDMLAQAVAPFHGGQELRVCFAFVTLTVSASGTSELGYILCDVRLPQGVEVPDFDLRIRWASCPMVAGHEAEAATFLDAYKRQGLVIDIAKEGLLTVFKTQPGGPTEGLLMQQSA